MLSTSVLRRVAAGLLLLSLALPSFTCAGYVAPDGSKVGSIPTGADSAAYKPARLPHYALKVWTPREAGFWIALLAFTWPIPMLALRRRPDSRLSRWLWWVEPLCAIAAGWLIWQIATLGQPASGTYVALTATATLLGVWVMEAWRAWATRASPGRLRASAS